ncbi:hypothetical protein BW14_06940 [Bifidobacterium sp. UTBIF-68]|uniref:hypothetical protein n=1 Tax=Bifidobacterium sp. UTBIF-68 TaxID=1465262 RepID=UPI00112E3079|nr:hypothetical protein [Bifidobacterium sp. UTBIF-68]TPF92893.1 hypothetical protein BW14_06940 [Bifidobacterium sp. UTBIF-68]
METYTTLAQIDVICDDGKRKTVLHSLHTKWPAADIAWMFMHAFVLQATDYIRDHPDDFPDGADPAEHVYEVTDMADECEELAMLWYDADIDDFLEEICGLEHVTSARMTVEAHRTDDTATVA